MSEHLAAREAERAEREAKGEPALGTVSCAIILVIICGSEK